MTPTVAKLHDCRLIQQFCVRLLCIRNCLLLYSKPGYAGLLSTTYSIKTSLYTVSDQQSSLALPHVPGIPILAVSVMTIFLNASELFILSFLIQHARDV